MGLINDIITLNAGKTNFIDLNTKKKKNEDCTTVPSVLTCAQQFVPRQLHSVHKTHLRVL